MTAEAGKLLVEEIAPRLRVAIPQSVRAVGADDHEELIQDAIVIAAMMLSRTEAAGKKVTAGNIAYYAVLHIKSGRRSTGSSKVDVMASGSRVSGRVAVHSLEEEIGYFEGFEGPVTLQELLACNADDPATAAARKLDWSSFLADIDQRQMLMLHDAAEGRPMTSSNRKQGVAYAAIHGFKRDLADKARRRLGEDILGEVARKPMWKAGLIAESEKAACRAARR